MGQVISVARIGATKNGTPDKASLEVPIASIQVGNRVRKAFGDLDGLADSLETVGLLQPVAVAKEKGKYVLVAGHRRLLALKQARLGDDTGPSHGVTQLHARGCDE